MICSFCTFGAHDINIAGRVTPCTYAFFVLLPYMIYFFNNNHWEKSFLEKYHLRISIRRKSVREKGRVSTEVYYLLFSTVLQL